MVKFKKGQEVRIKCIEARTEDDGYIFTSGMVKYWGVVTIITEVIHRGNLRLECAGDRIGWSPAWVGPADFLDDVDFNI